MLLPYGRGHPARDGGGNAGHVLHRPNIVDPQNVRALLDRQGDDGRRSPSPRLDRLLRELSNETFSGWAYEQRES